MSELTHNNHVGGTFATVGTEARFTAKPLLVPGGTVTVVNRGGVWQLGDGTPTTFTGRVCSLRWIGTAAQIPAQGTGDADFQDHDTAYKRTTAL